MAPMGLWPRAIRTHYKIDFAVLKVLVRRWSIVLRLRVVCQVKIVVQKLYTNGLFVSLKNSPKSSTRILNLSTKNKYSGNFLINRLFLRWVSISQFHSTYNHGKNERKKTEGRKKKSISIPRAHTYSIKRKAERKVRESPEAYTYVYTQYVSVSGDNTSLENLGFGQPCVYMCVWAREGSENR